MPKDYMVYLEDITEAIAKIERYVASLSLEEFLRREMAIDATVRNLEVIGEAVKRIPEHVKNKHQMLSGRR